MLPNSLKFQPVYRDFVFGHHALKVVLWLFVRCTACFFVSDNNSMKSTQILISFTDSVMGMHRQWLKDTDVCAPTISTQAAKSSPVTGLEWSRGFQEVKVPRFHENGTGRW